MPLSLPQFLRLTARIALLGLVFQISAVGHWSFGPFHADSGDIASHAAHCHGNLSGCAGEPSFSGSLAEVTLTPAAPLPRLGEAVRTVSIPGDPFLLPPANPPKLAA